jgi:hypothetical protein
MFRADTIKWKDSKNIFFKKIAGFGKQIMSERASMLVVLLASSVSALVLYRLFFAFSGIIWSQNVNVDFDTLSPLIRAVVASPGQRDGIEVYVLYVLVFSCIALTLFFVWLFDYLQREHKNRSSMFLFFAFIFGALSYYLTIGFNPPVSDSTPGFVTFAVMAAVMCILWLFIIVASQKERVADFMVIVGLLPICFIAVSKISIFDYSFIFAPALRILEHFELKDIYFQYDMLLSLIAAVWMKLNMDLNSFQVIGQLSFYVLFLASFFFSKRFFLKKQLAYYFLVSLVLVKIYALMHDPVLVFQVTPLRLDWWLLLIVLTFIKGIHNKLIGIALGLMIIFHRTFGLIYTIGYFEIICALFLLDSIGNRLSFKLLKVKAREYSSLYLPNIIIIAFSFLASSLLLGGNSMEAANDYQKIGIGFMPISEVSFYWYFPVLVSATAVLLIKKRKDVSVSYFNSSLLLIALSIGNSIYFFGRSHEHNIINISASLIFVLFVFFDLVIDSLNVKGKTQTAWIKMISIVIPASFILLVTFFYSARIADKTGTQFNNILKRQTIYPYPLKDLWDISKVKKLTNNSKNVYFTGTDDFYYSYYGKYTQNGYFSPYASWIYKKDMTDFMQNLLDRGYYIVFPESEIGVPKGSKSDDDLLSKLKYNKDITKNGFRVVWSGE